MPPLIKNRCYQFEKDTDASLWWDNSGWNIVKRPITTDPDPLIIGETDWIPREIANRFRY